MESIVDVLQIIFWGIVLLVLIVVIHEGGHFLAARTFGVRVLEFMVGLPGPSIGFTRKGTRFGVTAVPLGGYARIAGMESGEENPHLVQAVAYLYERGTVDLAEVQDASETVGFDLEAALDILDGWGTLRRIKHKGGHYTYEAPAVGEYALGQARALADPEAFIAQERSYTYRALPWWKRVVILCAGSVFNLLTAIIIFTAILAVMGTAQVSMTITGVEEGFPAQEAGLVAGDTITAIDGTALASWEEFTQAIATHEPGDEITLTYTRDGASGEVDLEIGNRDGVPALGVIAGYESVYYSVPEALGQSFVYIGTVFDAITKLFNPATAGETVGNSTSLIGISVAAKTAADNGWLNFVWLIAAISISLGIMNLLPIPPLDGGKIVVETIERVMRRTIPVRVINAVSTTALIALLVFFLYMTNQDIQRYILG